MTPKEKAQELYEKMRREEYPWPAKWCALVAVDEILEMDLPILEEDADIFYDYWEQVKQEIEKL